MKKITLIIILFTSTLFSQNLIVNGSFELTTSTMPDNWNLESGDFSIENAIVSEGANSLKVSPTMPATLGGSPTSLITQSFTLSDTDEHTFSFKYYLEGSLLNNEMDLISYEFINVTSLNAHFFTEGDVIMDSGFVYNQWVSVTYTVQVLAFRNGATSTDIKLSLRSNAFDTGTGTKVFYDDFVLDSNESLGLNNVNQQNINVIDFIKNKNIYLRSNHNMNSYSIFALSGNQIVKKSRLNTDIINTEFLTTGVYIIVLNNSNGGVISKKIVIK